MAGTRSKSARKIPKKPGVYCVTIKAARKANKRCVRRFSNGKVRYLKSGNIKCPKTCRRK